MRGVRVEGVSGVVGAVGSAGRQLDTPADLNPAIQRTPTAPKPAPSASHQPTRHPRFFVTRAAPSHP